MLTAASQTIWAKTDQFRGQEEALTAWLPLFQHLDDALGVAERLWDDWLPLSTRRGLASAFGSGAAARSLFAFLAGSHDVGKASPAFAVQVPELADRMTAEGLRSDAWLRSAPDRTSVRHELVSYYALLDWCRNTGGLPGSVARQLATVVGAHHGLAPLSHTVQKFRHADHLIGSGLWSESRTELINRAAERSKVNAHFGGLRKHPVPQTALVQLSALVILADWIASNEDFFPLFPLHELPETDQKTRVDTAWKRADLPGRWHPHADLHDLEKFFSSRFSLPPGAAPHPTQVEAIRIAQSLGEPTLMIVEAAMGQGKTELALSCAEILAEKTGAGGVFIGLPTQATTDSMFERVLGWARSFESQSSVFLAHGKSGLNPEYERLRAEGLGVNILQESNAGQRPSKDRVTANKWLSDRRRGPLANLVVGTIDQLLFTALSSRHLMLRHLAFSQKVIVIDEAHAYDVYMSRFLDRALEWLGAYGCSVIILSATLPADRRVALLDAYAVGRVRAEGELVHSRRAERVKRFDSLRGDIGYPVIVVGQGDQPPLVALPEEKSSTPSPGTSLELCRISDDPESLIATLRAELADGGCAAVIHNTVRRVRATAAALRVAFPEIEVLVAHSQFLSTDRVQKDSLLLDRFGSPQRSTGRPHTAIVVATQVIEQSLDLDFDIMISDIAPVDLLLQRSGRLHRHARGEAQSDRPPRLRQPRLFLTGLDEAHAPPELDRGAVAVYGSHILLRTLAVLEGTEIVRIPSDIPRLVQKVYSQNPVGPESWQSSLAAAADEHAAAAEASASAAGAFLLGPVDEPGESLLNWGGHSVGTVAEDVRGRATVREGSESLEVLVLFRCEEGSLRTAPWAPGGGIPVPLNEAPNRHLTRRIQESSLRLPAALTQPWLIDRIIRELEESFDLPSWHGSKELAGELVIVFDSRNRVMLAGYELSYDVSDGLAVSRVEP